jgi:hypothetical protein
LGYGTDKKDGYPVVGKLCCKQELWGISSVSQAHESWDVGLMMNGDILLALEW